MIDKNSPDFVTSFARGITVIRAFEAEHPRMTLTDVAERAGLTRAASRRFLLTLCALGYARSDGKYFELTPRVLEIGYTYLAALDLSALIQPYLEEVTRSLEESSSAAVLDGDEISYIARSATRQRIISIGLNVGARLPAYATSMGQVLLANLPAQELAFYFKRARMERFTPKTKTNAGDIKAKLNKVRAQNYALADQELEEGLRSISVPVRNRAGQTVAAINVGVHASRVSIETLVEHHLPVLKQAAGHIEDALRARR